MVISELIVLNFFIELCIKRQLIDKGTVVWMDSFHHVVPQRFIRRDAKRQTLKLQDLASVKNLFWVLGVKPLSFSLVVQTSIEQLEHVNFTIGFV